MLGMAETNKGEIKMNKVKCTNCKEEVSVNLYFYGAFINVHEDPARLTRDYEATVCGSAICPCCGAEIHKAFKKSINIEDIIRLAGGRGN